MEKACGKGLGPVIGLFTVWADIYEVAVVAEGPKEALKVRGWGGCRRAGRG